MKILKSELFKMFMAVCAVFGLALLAGTAIDAFACEGECGEEVVLQCPAGEHVKSVMVDPGSPEVPEVTEEVTEEVCKDVGHGNGTYRNNECTRKAYSSYFKKCDWVEETKTVVVTEAQDEGPLTYEDQCVDNERRGGSGKPLEPRDGPCLSCDKQTVHSSVEDEEESNDDDAVSFIPVDTSVPDEPCRLPVTPIGFDVVSGIPNDQTLELFYYAPDATGVVARYGHYIGEWLEGQTTDSVRHMSLGGLTNGQHYWVQIRAFNSCGYSSWTKSIDPLP